MESSNKACIINVALGGWYPQGQNRLVKSLNFHGWNWDVLTWTDWPNDNYDKSCPYNVKAAAFEEAINQGYTHILWLDCSVWAVKDPNPIMDIINNEGYYIGQSGYNCAQTCSDKCLDYFEVTRDEAETMMDCHSGVMGVYTSNPTAKEFIEKFIQAGKDGAFLGSRLHNGQSEDPRFLFHRQDQSAASIISSKLEMKLSIFGEMVAYYPEKIDNVIFALRGM